jgi:hypothetical protein
MATWLKIDTRMHSHPVTASVGDAALGYWLRLALWLAEYPNPDDYIDEVVAKHLLYGQPVRRLNALVEAGLLVPGPFEPLKGYVLRRPMNVGGSGLTEDAWTISASVSRPKIPDTLRASIYERDGYRCVECEATEDLSLDHIWPFSKGGEDTYENLRTLCRPCNSRKGARV